MMQEACLYACGITISRRTYGSPLVAGMSGANACLVDSKVKGDIWRTLCSAHAFD